MTRALFCLTTLILIASAIVWTALGWIPDLPV